MMRRSLNALVMLAACGGPPYYSSHEYARTHPATADLVATSLTQGCPVEGAPAEHLRKTFGPPVIRYAADSSSAMWRFGLDGASTLEVMVQGDTVVEWGVAGRPSPRIAQLNYSWSDSQAKGFPRRVIEYLSANPEVGSRTAFLLLRGCPAPGLSEQALQASWGTPSEIKSSGDTTRWIYGFGVEGQHDIIFLVSDTVRAFRTVGWTPGD
jgi:hypothetical protein